jgi:UDP-N-acetyl-D-glucosamine dehydrogenase
MCDRLGIDVWEVIDAAATKPFGFMPFYPGPGIGGHCIPLDPFYLSWKMKTLDYRARFIELAGEVNSEMPRHVVTKITEALNEHEKSVKGADILVLGVAYKPDISDPRESPALDIIELLWQLGANVSYSDPYVASVRIGEHQYASVPLTQERLKGADCVVIATNHSDFDYRQILDSSTTIVDTRNSFKGVIVNRDRVFTL